MTTTLNWGILSSARINRRLIPAVKAATRSTMLAVASRNQDKAQEYAAQWDIPRAYGSYEALLAAPDINAVYIPLPNTLHKEWVIKAAQAGKHILCEKPLAMTVAEVDEMAAAAQENGVTLLEAFMYRMHPQLANLKALIAEGLIGRVKLVSAKFSFTLRDENNIRLQKEMGGGALWDVGCYPVSFAQAIAEEDPQSVFGWQRVNASGADTLFAGQMQYRNGITAQIDAGFEIPFRAGAEVVGDKGVLSVPVPWIPDTEGNKSGLIHIAPDDTETRIPTEIKDPYLCEVEALENAVLDGAPLLYTLAHSRGNVATINALYRSADG
ncbi:MAG: hypothetical protein B6243_09225 [Anaerolineaceae bacterium 4572_5.2]|nr:MAG: hypothetical protein B6243_09225 [Anaerolineaceae bacterium 4572_5.2]